MSTTTHASDEDSLSPSQLCKACGLCCRGVWFSNTSLQAGELEQARAIGLEVIHENDSAKALQPCPQHREGCCASYQTWRPDACQTYRCQVLADFESGRLGAREALGHVRSAVTMAERIFAEKGAMRGGIKGDDFMRLLDPDSPPDVLSANARIDAVALLVYYKNHFQERDEGQ